MILSKTPYRVSISGGSCDYASFYSKYGCILTGFALNKYCYVSVKPLTKTSESNFEIYYSSSEKVKDIRDIQNPTVRGTLDYFNSFVHPISGLSIYIGNDLGHQSGLATSSALVVGLLNCLYSLYDLSITKKQLAELAVYIERILLKQSGGIQDSYWCSYGGFNSIEIAINGHVDVRPLSISEDFIKQFCDSSLLFYLSSERKSFEIAKSHDNEEADGLKQEILDLSYETKRAFDNEDIEDVGYLLNKSWLNKKRISSLISNEYIDGIYDKVMSAGAYGMKICGTGGSGFCFVICDAAKKEKLIEEINLPHIDTGIDYAGSRIIFKE